MIDRVEPYPGMKDSGADWLGEVPAHWQVRSLGTFGRFSKGSGGTKADETEQGVPCVRYGDLYTTHRFHIRESKACVAPDRALAYTPVRYGDVLFAGSGETLEEIGKSAVNLIRGPAVCGGDVIVFRAAIDVDPEFIGWSTDCRQAASQKARMGRGITVMHIYSNDLKYLAIPLPPLPEQTAIARFLNDADRRIRRYIRAKERLIELLEEEGQATIHEAVTGRIDVRTGQPYPAYKESEVEWLGEVPEHWDVVQLGRVAVERCDGPFGSGLKSSHYTDGGVRVVRLQNIGHGEYRNDDSAFISTEHYSTLGDHSVEPDDLLIAGLGDRNHPAGRACVAPREIGPAMVKADCFRFRLERSQALPRFVALQLTATALGAAGLSRGATRQRVNLSGTAGRRITLPPLSEQTAIVRYLDATERRSSARRAMVARQIDLLREYRTCLIADVVMGKFDVREAAAKLPETDRLAADRDRPVTIPTAPNHHESEHDMAKEARA